MLRQSSLRFFVSFFIASDGKFIVDPQYEGKIRAKVADVFQFRKEQEVDEHYKMIEEVLEDDKMVCPLFFFQFFGLHLVLQSFSCSHCIGGIRKKCSISFSSIKFMYHG